MIDTEKTIGEIARENPAAVRVFQSYKIDFCCGGKRAIDDACREQGISIDALVQELDRAISPAAAAEKDWGKAPLAALVEHILRTHHDYLKAELPRLEAMLDKVLSAHGENHGAMLRPLAVVFRGMRAELFDHMQKEELILFPYVVQKEAGVTARSCFGTVRNPIRMMELEHESAGAALVEMRRLTNGYQPPEDACNTFRGLLFGLNEVEADLHQHIHLENNILFPRSVELEG